MAMMNEAARNQVFADLSADRAIAAYAARPMLDGKARAEMLVHLIEVARMDGRLDAARAYASLLRPIMHLLPEGD